MRQICLFPQRIQNNMSFIFIVVSRTWKSLTPKEVTVVKRLTVFTPKMDYNLIPMGLPAVPTAVFHSNVFGKMLVSWWT
jgi:hypothetical protein